jgi:Fe-S cluster assembly iron-binding protein IscA
MFDSGEFFCWDQRIAAVAVALQLRRATQLVVIIFASVWLTSCAGLVQSQTAQLPIAVAFTSPIASLQVSQAQTFTVTIQNDTSHSGVVWSLSGSGCSGAACGTLTNASASSVDYRAPANAPVPPTVTLTATSIADGSKSASAIITITATPPPISVSIAPASTSVQVSTAANFTVSVQNDSQNKGVTWSVSGPACTGTTCGTLSNVTTTSVTYTAPASVPSPATVTITATSVTDTTKSKAASVTLTSAPLPIAVSVSPATTSVQVSTAANFTASVQNDSQNKGVIWSVSGPGCSGATCGTLSNVTTTSVTYTAPASAPSPAFVVLVATSVADNTKNAQATLTITQPSSGGGTPGFAANHVSGSSTQGNGVSRYDFRLPNGTMSGNCIVVGFQYSAGGAGVTASVSDDKGNAYSAPISHNDGNQVVNLSFALNVASGTQKISIKFSGGAPPFVSALATEFYNIAPANAMDGFSGSDGTGTSVPAGSFTPSTGGDLIYQYAVQDSSSNPMISWSQGIPPWTLLSADVLDGSAAQYQVQTSAAPINPTLGMAPSQSFSSVAIALKSANSGSAPPPGIRVVRVQHHSVQSFASSPVRLQFPCTGNLIVLAWIGVPLHDITGVTDGNSNTYVSPGAAFGLGLSGDNQIYYAAGASTSSTMMGPSFTTTGSDISGSTAVLLDVSGAATSPYDATAGLAKASGVQNSAGNVTAVTISPSTANGLVISTLGVDSNTVNGVSPGNFLSAVPTPVASPNPVDQNNGWALWYNSSPGAGTFVWTTQGGQVDDWSSIAVAFKSAP